MGKSLADRINKNALEFYRLYLEGKRLEIDNNVLSFLLLSAIEEKSKYFMEILINKCKSPTLRRNIRSRIYSDHTFKYQIYLSLYYVMFERDIFAIIQKVKAISYKWRELRRSYLVNVSHTEISYGDMEEIERVYAQAGEIERGIKDWKEDESCDVLNTLVKIIENVWTCLLR